MSNLVFINFTDIIDESILSFIDIMDYNDPKSCLILSGDKMKILLTGKTKKILFSIICNNISSKLYFNKTNVIIKTCNPEKNWRNTCGSDINMKYVLKDDSIEIDLIEFNKFCDYVFKKLPSVELKQFNMKFTDAVVLNTIDYYKNNLLYLSFDDIDATDIISLLKEYYKYDVGINFKHYDPTIIYDGNLQYRHDSVFSNELKNNVQLQLLKKGIN